jgi:hypothetical protein
MADTPGLLRALQPLAAWSGAALGLLNLALAVLAKRPVLTFAPSRSLGETELRLRIVNLAREPLLVRKVWVFPRTVQPGDADCDAQGVAFDLRETWRFLEERRFLKLIPPEATGDIRLIGLDPGSWCFVVVRWHRRRAVLPFSVRVAGRGLVRDLHEVAGTTDR